MQNNFDACLAFTLQYEGGYVDNPRDPGGATNRGITLNTLRAYRLKPVTKADVMHLSRDEAAAIYRKNYWNAINADALPSGVDLIAFDIAVNMGIGRVRPWLAQTASLAPAARIKRLDALRLGFWRVLRTFPVFGKGWTRRESACLAAALKLV